MGLGQNYIDALAQQNIHIPTEIQAKTMDSVVAGKDIIIHSPTGTGKTLAYLLPLLQKIDTQGKNVQGLILVPTHELAMQICKVMENLLRSADIPLTVIPIVGGVNITRQIDGLKEKPQVVVGTPGRVLELLGKKKLTGHFIKTIVLDECDRLLEANAIEETKAIIKTTLKDRQIILVSASIPPAVMSLSKTICNDAIHIQVDKGTPVPSSIEHWFVVVERAKKIETLRKLVFHLKPRQAIVFINKNDQIERLAEKLRFHELSAESIHGAKFKADRQATLKDFTSGTLQLLIASDLAARGIDFSEVALIFNLDLPELSRDYQHRAGRTGRVGAKGLVISIITPPEVSKFKGFAQALGIDYKPKELSHGELRDPFKRNMQSQGEASSIVTPRQE